MVNLTPSPSDPPAIIFMGMPPVMVGLWQAFPGFFWIGEFQTCHYFWSRRCPTQKCRMGSWLRSHTAPILPFPSPPGSYAMGILFTFLIFATSSLATSQSCMADLDHHSCDGEQCWTESSVVDKWPCTSHWLNTLTDNVYIYKYMNILFRYKFYCITLYFILLLLLL